MITPVEQALIETLRSLPLERQRQVLDFAKFLALKANETHEVDIQTTALPSIDVRQLSGMLHQPRTTVSLEEMERAIAQGSSE
jgi:hypothetical protein